MIIKHIPNRINPYEYNDYGREPEYIISGDKVNVNCYIGERGEGKKAPTLIYLVDEKEELQTEGVYLYHKENRDYYTFPIGPFKEGTIITYAIRSMEDDRLIQTEWYPFEVLRIQEFYAPEEICAENYNTPDSMTLHCYYKLSETKKLNLSMEFRKDSISFQVSPVDRSSEDQQKSIDSKHQIYCSFTETTAELGSNTFEYRGEGYHVKLDARPFNFRVEDINNDLLIEFNNDTNLFQTFLDREDRVKQLTFSMDLCGKAFYGFGEKFDQVNQRGRKPKNCVYEHFTHQQEKTYLPVPYFITEKGYGFYYDTNQMVDFDIKAIGEENNTLTVKAAVKDYSQEHYKLKNHKSEDYKWESDIPENQIEENQIPQDKVILLFGSIREMLKQYIKRVGKMELPPRWAFGPWMSGNGWNTQKETLEQIDKMKKHQIPASVLVLEAWSDEATFYIFNDAEYEPKEGCEALEYKDFSFPEDGKWPNPKEMSDELHANNVKLVLWQIPVIKHFEIHEQKQHENDEATALAKGYHVKLADGSPYRITDHWFADSLLLDFNNPEAVKWWFSKRTYLTEELHVDGFKTDGGEFVYDNRTLFFDGKNGSEMRNLYPNSYVGSYYKFLKQSLGEGNGITFSRAGYKGAGSFPIHWAGDQKSEFSELRAQLKAGLSAGLSGVFFWGFDIAGFAGDLPSTDLYLRSSAIAAFSPVMQFHSEPRTGQFG
ncbi:MAG: TIM-barrel domain-containing protein, partial [Mobilitalea sp.]